MFIFFPSKLKFCCSGYDFTLDFFVVISSTLEPGIIFSFSFDIWSYCPEERAMAPHSSTFAWKIPWMEEPGRLQSMGSRRVGEDWVTSLSLFTFMHWRSKWQPTPVFLPGESQGWGSLVGCRLWRSHRVGHNWSDRLSKVSPPNWLPLGMPPCLIYHFEYCLLPVY